ncbi:winged helix-turn-helix domain-containing protein [Serratia fonticola]|uniref:Phosphate regulon transcriptional regulatory protein PhoB n=1 Tax=Serratia fonticola TaxID=47917 RepID=A0A3S4X977_SERFO|nr:winged helix-turn-helix domain-containing protein [Serratia fonticola]CAI1800413.1 phosphate regulon transcriptional regulatory protein PhoB [Serratia fonticola]VEI68329.1 phosphate regulon transcriptional regulatory protein PhoB [Serratia fonticola]
MNYIINGSLLFDTEEHLLSNEQNNKTLTLSAISSRLLCELLKNPAGVTREHLLNVVWSEHGLTASNNNLNNHISILRKHLEELADLHDLIKTVPKKGFALNRNHMIVLVEGEGQPVRTVQGSTVRGKPSFRSIYMSLALFILVLLALFTSLYGDKIHSMFSNTQPKTFYKYKGCVLKTLREIPEKKRQASIALVMEMIRKNDVDCEYDRYDVFFYLSGEEQSANQFRMLSLCRNEKGGNYDHCYSIKVV